MTKKHFQVFADAIKKIEDRETAKDIAEVCIDVFEDLNPRFDSIRFLKAAGFGKE